MKRLTARLVDYASSRAEPDVTMNRRRFIGAATGALTAPAIRKELSGQTSSG